MSVGRLKLLAPIAPPASSVPVARGADVPPPREPPPASKAAD